MAQVKADLALAKGDVGLGNVDNTSDANKPVSTAVAAALPSNEASMPSGWAIPVTSASPFISTVGAAPGSNIFRGMRIIIPKAGNITVAHWYIGVSSGNYKFIIFDTGQASAGNYTVLYVSGSTAVGTADTWSNALNPNLAVTKGQHIMAGIVFDNVTASFGRFFAPDSNARAALPPGFGPAPGSTVRSAVTGTVTFASVAASYSDATLGVLSAGPAIALKVT